MTLLVTSIPPSVKRLDKAGCDVGPDYQLRCLKSWEKDGFSILSVNSPNESLSLSNDFRQITVNNDASFITSRPHVLISDLLLVAKRESRGRPFAVANSDVILSSPLSTMVDSLIPGELIYGRRIDIEEVHETTGITYDAGFDFFACHPSDVQDLKAKLAFGAPWWDHYLPLTMFRNGLHLRQLRPAVLHLKHHDRWSWDAWRLLGEIFIAEMLRFPHKDSYRIKLDRAIHRRTGRILSDLKYAIWKRLPHNAAGEPMRLLERVSDADISFLDEVSDRGTVP